MSFDVKHISFAVTVDNRRVGRLTWSEGDYHEFEVDRDYDWSHGDPILSLSLKQPDGSVERMPIRSRYRLPPFFSNLLPEGHLREYLAAQAGVKPLREFFLLQALREDLPGAIRLHPIGNTQSNRSGDERPAEQAVQAQTDDTFRFSLAGVQIKFSAVMEASGGLTIPAHGVGGSFIVKLPSTRFADVPETEFALMTLAKQLGMDIADVELRDTSFIKGLPENLPENFGRSLVVKRFDRNGLERIHMEDFAQVFSIYPEEKYEHVSYGGIAKVIYIEAGVLQVQEFVRRLTFNLMIGNADMHLKNWSLLYRDPQHPVLAPGYDFVSTIAYLPDQKFALSIAKEKMMANIEEEHFRKMAAKAGLPEELVVRTMRDTAGEFRAKWRKAVSEIGLTKTTVEKISDHLSGLKI